MMLKFSLHYPLILSSIHFRIAKMTAISPLHDIDYYSLYDAKMMPWLTTDIGITIQFESMIVVSDLTDILVSG